MKILGLKTNLSNGLSDNLRAAFPNINPIFSEEYKIKEIPDPNWVAGFVSAEGSFFIRFLKTTSCKAGIAPENAGIRFGITLHKKDYLIIEKLFAYFKASGTDSLKFSLKENGVQGEAQQKEIKRISKGVFYSGETVKLYFSKFSDNYDIIIPFFTKYPVAGIKSLDFLDFKKVAELIKNKKHKTMESYKEIVKINSTMNDRRPW